MGWTVWEILIAIDRALHTYDRSILICFPTRDDVADFSKSRFARLMEQNPSLGKHIKGTDSANIKAVGKVFIYFRGAKSRSQLKSIPCDMVTFDERDEMEESMVELADKRLDGSDFKHRISLSTPSIPDYGVDYEYKHSDQSHWLIKCDGCGKYTCLELEFPSCLKRLEDRVMRVCVHCGHEVHPVHGEWVAMKPAHDRRGYYVSQLNSPTVDPKQILTEWEFLQQEGRDVTEFYNSRLGLAYADVESALDEGLCLSACKSHVRAQSNKGPCAMGVDIGPKELHWWIVSRPDEKSLRTQNYGKVKTFEELQGKSSRDSRRSSTSRRPYLTQWPRHAQSAHTLQRATAVGAAGTRRSSVTAPTGRHRSAAWWSTAPSRSTRAMRWSSPRRCSSPEQTQSSRPRSSPSCVISLACDNQTHVRGTRPTGGLFAAQSVTTTDTR
jgi:hypothetical protein